MGYHRGVMTDVDRPTVRSALAAALVFGVFLSGCAAPSGMPGGDHHTVGSAAQANEADAMFAEMMVPHHEQAISMSEMILAKPGVDPAVTTLAEQIKAAQQPEIDTMNGWLDEWGRPSMPAGHNHHDMGGGMLDEKQMRALDQADGPSGQRLYLDGMIAHHEGAIAMAETEIAEGRNRDAIALARSIVDAQRAEVTTMNQILDRL